MNSNDEQNRERQRARADVSQMVTVNSAALSHHTFFIALAWLLLTILLFMNVDRFGYLSVGVIALCFMLTFNAFQLGKYYPPPNTIDLIRRLSELTKATPPDDSDYLHPSCSYCRSHDCNGFCQFPE